MLTVFERTFLSFFLSTSFLQRRTEKKLNSEHAKPSNSVRRVISMPHTISVATATTTVNTTDTTPSPPLPPPLCPSIGGDEHPHTYLHLFSLLLLLSAQVLAGYICSTWTHRCRHEMCDKDADAKMNTDFAAKTLRFCTLTTKENMTTTASGHSQTRQLWRRLWGKRDNHVVTTAMAKPRRLHPQPWAWHWRMTEEWRGGEIVTKLCW